MYTAHNITIVANSNFPGQVAPSLSERLAMRTLCQDAHVYEGYGICALRSMDE